MTRKLAALGTVLLMFAASAFADSQGRLAPQPNIIFEQGVGDTFVFPVAGNVEGVNRTHFRSEVTLANYKGQDQEVLVEFLEQGATVPYEAQRILLEAGRFYFWEDFVGTMIVRPGKLGAIIVRAVIAGTTVTDNSAQINGFSRIWTWQPDGPGTSSMALEAIREDNLGSTGTGTAPASILGLRQDTQYRANVGVVNLAANDRVFTVRIVGSRLADPITLTVPVPARSMQQVALPEGNFGALSLTITPSSTGAWTAYGASVDNQSGDGWVSNAIYPTRMQ